jgi:membrane AbrB-like protein
LPIRTLGTLFLTGGLGAVGGGLFAWLGLPAAWLAGAMTATAAAALAGLPLSVPARLRDAAFVLLGASMGTSVTPETVQQLGSWPWSLALLAGSVLATLQAGALYLRRCHGWDAETARYASIPGALSSVLVLAATSAADLPRVALAQSVRLFTLVALMPAALSSWGDVGAAGPAPPAVSSTLPEIAATLAASAAAAALLAALRVPGGVLLGAMVASAILHGAGLAGGRLPPALLIPGFVATGAVIGTRFRGTSLAVLRATLPGAVGSVLLALTLSAGFAATGAYWLDLPFGQLWLAYAPGGVEAMAVMALALQLDPAFVGAHHVIRILGLNLLVPFWQRSPPSGRAGTR